MNRYRPILALARKEGNVAQEINYEDAMLRIANDYISLQDKNKQLEIARVHILDIVFDLPSDAGFWAIELAYEKKNDRYKEALFQPLSIALQGVKSIIEKMKPF